MTFSVFALWNVATAGPYADLDARLQKSQTRAQAESVLRARPIEDASLAERVDELGSGPEDDAELKQIRKTVHALAVAEKLSDSAAARQQVVQIKKLPLYRDRVDEDSNWLGNALDRLAKLVPDLSQREAPKAPAVRLGAWVNYVMWAILGIAICFFVYLAVRHFNWQARLSRKAKALLEEDEPERTVDEWLEQADLMAAQGRHRDAVRCLYLACLLRFDEAGVARFDRGQTNWEHLERIQASPRRPAGLDFVEPTRDFDRIWYGKIVRGMEDVERFRASYQNLTYTLKEKAA